MARLGGKLSAKKVASAKAGRHGDGNGLWLAVAPSGSASWIFRFTFSGKVREIGLGSASRLGLADARKAAQEARQAIAEGRHPKVRQQGAVTFGEAADAYLAAHRASWRNRKHRDQWAMTLAVYAGPLRELPVAAIDTQAVLGVLSPIWRSKPETASRLRGRIEAVLDSARVAGHIGEREPNPARWAGHLEMLLPRPAKLSRGHHAAMNYDEVPAFMARLAGQGGMAALAMRFTILTAGRTGEVLGAEWREIDLGARLWTVPPGRMKSGREHRVPLSPPAMAVLKTLLEVRRDEFVFAGMKRGCHLSNMSMLVLLRRMRVAATAHGFRSAFRDWAGDRTAFPREVAEAALAHAIGDKAEQAYRRGDALEKRRGLMDAWAAFCDGK
jgi:integrase